MIEHQSIDQIYEVFKVIYRSAKESSPASSDPVEMIELIKPLLRSIFVESLDYQIGDEAASFRCSGLFQRTIKKIKLQNAQINFVERHKFTRLQRLFDIRALLQEYHERERRPIDIIQLWKKLRCKCDFDLSQELLERRLHQMGFRLADRRENGFGRLIHEHPGQRLNRLKYLRAMRKHRENDRNLLYFREATIAHMRWNMHEMDPSRAETTETVIAYIVAAESGLVDFVFAEQGQQRCDTFIDWLKSVIKTEVAAKPNALILLDPKSYSDNTDTTRMAKVMTAMAAHDVLFLPPNHPELNPLHRIDLTHVLDGDRSAEEDDKLENIKAFVRHRLTTTTEDEWKQFFTDVQKTEENFLRFEAFLDDDAICVDDIPDSEPSDVEVIEEIDDNIIHLNDSKIIIL